jgi:sialic acid synthase SpsE
MQIIAEIGSNWRRYDDEAKNWVVAEKQIRLAKENGATAVKFQYFKCRELFGKDVVGSYFESEFNKFALPFDWLLKLAETCKRYDIEFMCSAFSAEGYAYVDHFVNKHKIASPEACHHELVNYVAELQKPFYYSDGCLDKVYKNGIPMACVSKYPADISDYDLCYGTITKEWGLSDHTLTNALVHIALHNGATHFEKHVDFCQEGSETPDTCVSVNKRGWLSWVNAIRNYDPDRYDKIRKKSQNMYGRRKTPDGWFRPIPKTANLRKL